MLELIAGLAVIALWIVLQFVIQVPSGWIHLLLAAGVILVIRGITFTVGTADRPSPTGRPR